MGITGTNNIPLGVRRRTAAEDLFVPPPPPPPEDDLYGVLPPPPPADLPPPPPSPPSDFIPPPPPDFDSDSINGTHRRRADEREDDSDIERRGRSATVEDAPRKRKRKNRWGAAEENHVANLINMPTSITGNMTPEQVEAYVLNLRIEEISQKLRINDVVPRDGERSPSPPPQYDANGKRINTREVRYRKKLEDERHRLVEKAMKTIPDFKPPADYRRPLKTQEKVFVPVNDYPEINFIGQLIGPRGNTLKKMETESGAKIAIRGKGSVKEGKGRSDAAFQSNLEEDLHCLIIADTEEKVQKAIKLVNKVIQTAASIPEGQNELKRNQLRELAALNGTLRDDENQACQNCGELGHRKYDCPHQRNFTANVICRICGNAGHFARDCKERPQYGFRNGGPQQGSNANGPDKEYERLMLELSGSGGSSSGGNVGAIEAGPGQDLRSGPPSGPNGYRSNNYNNHNNQYPPPHQGQQSSVAPPLPSQPPPPSAPSVAPWKRASGS
ncbi:hypothetical protein V1511DRAFT_506401 [Dipodascopsis uninucleata]